MEKAQEPDQQWGTNPVCIRTVWVWLKHSYRVPLLKGLMLWELGRSWRAYTTAQYKGNQPTCRSSEELTWIQPARTEEAERQSWANTCPSMHITSLSCVLDEVEDSEPSGVRAHGFLQPVQPYIYSIFDHLRTGKIHYSFYVRNARGDSLVSFSLLWQSVLTKVSMEEGRYIDLQFQVAAHHWGEADAGACTLAHSVHCQEQRWTNTFL